MNTVTEEQWYKEYLRQVRISTWCMYVLFLVFIAVACGVSLATVNSSTEMFKAILFFAVLLAITVIIGTYVLVVEGKTVFLKAKTK